MSFFPTASAKFTDIVISGTSQVPTQTGSDSSQKIASTAFVKGLVGSGFTTAAITSGTIDGTTVGQTSPAAGKFTALIATVSATGVTPGASDNSTAFATTAWVQTKLLAGGVYDPTAVNITGGTIATANISSARVTATPANSVARNLNSFVSDAFNVKNFGATMNGTTNDSTAFQNAYNAALDNGTIIIPPGGLNIPGLTYSTSKRMNWLALGPVNFGTNTLGDEASAVFSMGPDDTFVGFLAGRYQVTRISTNRVGAWGMNVDFTNNNTGGGVTSAFHVNSVQSPAANGFQFANLTELYSRDTNGTNQNVAVGGTVWKSGNCPVWGLWSQVTDYTGIAGGAMNGIEINIACNGPEPSVTQFAASGGARVGILFANQSLAPSVWQASHAYAVGDTLTASPANGFVYKCTVAGTSAGTQPVWPTTSGSVLNGTATFAFMTTIQSQISRTMEISGSAQVGIGLYASDSGTTFYSSFLDCSGSTFSDNNVASLRMAANQPIDFSGLPTSGLGGGQRNLHTMLYNSGTTSLEYQVSKTRVFAISDAGGVGIQAAAQVGVTLKVAGSNAVGIDLSGGTFTYALRLLADQALAWESSQAVTTKWNSTTGRLTDTYNGVVMRSTDGSGNHTIGGAMQVGGSSGPSISSGAAAPSGAAVSGSIYLRTAGSANNRIYISNGTTWAAITST